MYSMIVRVWVVLKRTVVGDRCLNNLTLSEDDFRSGCRNVSHQQQFFSEPNSPGRSHSTNKRLHIKKSMYADVWQSVQLNPSTTSATE